MMLQAGRQTEALWHADKTPQNVVGWLVYTAAPSTNPCQGNVKHVRTKLVMRSAGQRRHQVQSQFKDASKPK